MTFDTWWETLTGNERRLLGENNAKFVWNVAFFQGYSEGSSDGYTEALNDVEENK